MPGPIITSGGVNSLGGPGMANADITKYTKLITSEHQNKPNFIATISIGLQAMANLTAIANGLPSLFDLDTATGQQLDFTGQWIGPTREIQILQHTAGFSWDVPGEGWDQAVWTSGIQSFTTVTLNDNYYRTLLYARTVANQWDGTIPDAYTAWDIMFTPFGYSIKIYDDSAGRTFTWDTSGLGWDHGLWQGADFGVMTMRLELDGTSIPPNPPALLKALLKGGYLDLRPAGVRITQYLINGVIV